MTTRLDISVVPHQGGYIAKRCPVVIQNRMLVPELEVGEHAADVRMRMDDGVRFEAAVVAEFSGPGDWTLITERYPDEAVPPTLEAMGARAPVIHGGYLPNDDLGRRSGKPDLLVHWGDGYVPVDIKHRKTLDFVDGEVSISEILAPKAVGNVSSRKLRANGGDALQLAHYRRMLEAAGYESSTRIAGIIGKDLVIVWYDLDEPMWSGASTMEYYDARFDQRLDIAATAIARKVNGGGELSVEPRWCSDCGGCGFHDYCMETLGAGSGDASLIPSVREANWLAFREAGIRTREQVAALHYPTAALTRVGVELPFFLDKAQGQSDDTSLRSLRPQARTQIANLEAAGLHTVADLARIDPLTAQFGKSTDTQILESRAHLGEAPVHRKPGKAGLGVPRADIEIDIDMENMNEGVYLWGVLVTDRVGSGLFDEGYRAFTTWEPLDDQSEQAPFLEMLDWLHRQIEVAHSNGLTLKSYVWYEPAENSQLRRIAGAVDCLERVEELIASEVWVDLREVFNEDWMTGGSTSLKVIAPLAGFEWPVDDPGGGLSMAKYREVVDQGSSEAERWLLDYNRGDVEATKAIREWLDQHGANWPEVPTD